MYKRKLRSWVKHLDFILLDELCLWASILLAFWIGVKSGRPVRDNHPNVLVISILAVNFVIMIALNTMDEVVHRGYYKEMSSVAKQAVASLAVAVLVLKLREDTIQFPARVILLILVFYLPSTYFCRVKWKKFLRRHPRIEGPGHSVLLVADDKHAAEIIRRMREFSLDRYTILGVVYINRDAKGETVEGVSVAANMDDAADFICRNWIDEVFFFNSALDERAQDLMSKCREMALTIHLYIGLQGVDESKQSIDRIAGFNVLTANINTISAHDAALKRAFDMVAGVVGSIAALGLMAILAPFILRESPGPLLFKQDRIGENGRKFKMYKIRSMYVDAEERKAEYLRQNTHDSGMMFKMEFDPRVIGNVILPDGRRKTGIGDFIRRTSLDEFPQFFNVLKGDMSVVGTRPPTLDEWEGYHYHHRARMSVRPGLTGLWQINKRKDKMSFEEVVKLDTEYIASWNIGQDLRIIAKTALRMLHAVREKDGDTPKTEKKK